jgi:hypothetical protein
VAGGDGCFGWEVESARTPHCGCEVVCPYPYAVVVSVYYAFEVVGDSYSWFDLEADEGAEVVGV